MCPLLYKCRSIQLSWANHLELIVAFKYYHLINVNQCQEYSAKLFIQSKNNVMSKKMSVLKFPLHKPYVNFSLKMQSN